MQQKQTIDKDWFLRQLEEANKSVRGLARHLEIDASAASRMLSGQRKMRMNEANSIAYFLGAPVSEVLKHAGVSTDLDGRPTRVLLAATINSKGEVERLKEPKPLPPSVVERAQTAIMDDGVKIIAAQIRAGTGPLAVMDDAVVLFRSTHSVEAAAIGVLSICRSMDGDQIMAKIERARKTGEAKIIDVTGKAREVELQTATPILAIIP